jgi:hypothetical protein
VVGKKVMHWRRRWRCGRYGNRFGQSLTAGTSYTVTVGAGGARLRPLLPHNRAGANSVVWFNHLHWRWWRRSHGLNGRWCNRRFRWLVALRRRSTASTGGSATAGQGNAGRQGIAGCWRVAVVAVLVRRAVPLRKWWKWFGLKHHWYICYLCWWWWWRCCSSGVHLVVQVVGGGGAGGKVMVQRDTNLGGGGGGGAV